MCITAEQLETEPIVLFTFDCDLDPRLSKQLALLFVRFSDCIREPLTIIADVRLMGNIFFDLLQRLQDAERETPGTVFRSNIQKLIFVSTPAVAQTFRALPKQPNILMVDSPNTALEIARSDLALPKAAV